MRLAIRSIGLPFTGQLHHNRWLWLINACRFSAALGLKPRWRLWRHVLLENPAGPAVEVEADGRRESLARVVGGQPARGPGPAVHSEEPGVALPRLSEQSGPRLAGHGPQMGFRSCAVRSEDRRGA
jgi:hypothetical protein